MLFTDMFDPYFFEEYLREKRGLSDSSIQVYVNAVEQFLLKYDNVEDVDSYNKFLLDKAVKQRAVHYYSALKAFIEYKVKDAGTRNVIIDNLIKPEQPQNIKRERKYLDEEKILDIINNLKSPKHRIIGLIQTLTGVRAGDVLNIRRGNIVPELHDGNPVVRIVIEGKGQKRNVVYIHDEVAQSLIIDYIVKSFNNADYYFVEDSKIIKPGENFYTRRLIRANYERYKRDLKIAMNLSGVPAQDFASHDYRRCYARRVWTKYKDLTILQNLLNHSNPATTMRYLSQSGLKNVDYHKEMQDG